MSKFENVNESVDSVISKEIDRYLISFDFRPEKNPSQENSLERMYSKNGIVTYVTIYENRVHIFREDSVGGFLWEKTYHFEDSTTKNIETFRSFMDDIYEEIFF